MTVRAFNQELQVFLKMKLRKIVCPAEKAYFTTRQTTDHPLHGLHFGATRGTQINGSRSSWLASLLNLEALWGGPDRQTQL